MNTGTKIVLCILFILCLLVLAVSLNATHAHAQWMQLSADTQGLTLWASGSTLCYMGDVPIAQGYTPMALDVGTVVTVWCTYPGTNGFTQQWVRVVGYTYVPLVEVW